MWLLSGISKIEDGLAAGRRSSELGRRLDEADRCVARDYFTRHVGAVSSSVPSDQ